MPERLCMAQIALLREAGVNVTVTEPPACTMPATHRWHDFYLCGTCADHYNRAFGVNDANRVSVDYQPIDPIVQFVERERERERELHDTSPLIAPEHAGDILDIPCTECGTSIHCCNLHNEFGCNRRNTPGWNTTGPRCSLCQRCVRALNHRHCDVARCVVNDGWLCSNCGGCEDCRANDGGDMCEICIEIEREAESDPEPERSSVIHEYHGYSYPKAVPEMRDGLHKGQPYLWIGVELESEMIRGGRDIAAEAIHAVYGEGGTGQVVIADDCSLAEGFETITGPMGLTYHQALWPELAPFMARQGCRAWKRPHCGMHVHVSRNFFSQLEIGKLMVFMNSPKTRDMITRLAGRGSMEYSTYVQKKLTDVKSDYARRHESLNVTNDATLEFRVFQGTLSPGHILANIEFVHALCMYVKNASLRVIEDWPLFWRYVTRYRTSYQHLVEFMELNVIREAA
jgi:hypothetical protein